MRGVRSRPRRVARRLPAVVGALALHAVLLAALAWQRTPAADAERIVSVQLIDLRPERPPAEPRPSRPDAARPAPAMSAPRPAVLPLPVPEPEDVGSAPPVGSGPPQPGLSRQALAGILSRATACDPQTIDRLPAKKRADCARRVLEAGLRTGPLMPKGARRYARMYEHVEIMGDVRRAENGGERASCNARRHLEPICENALPDNLPKDYRLPNE